MLSEAWYAVALTEAVSERPTKVTVHGRDFILFRDDDNTPHAFVAYCPHRGCDLSRGTVEKHRLVCPFHGWRFDTSGVCTHIPANPGRRQIPARARLRAYSACDHAGFTWIYTGALNRPFPSFRDLDSDGWTCVPFQDEWAANFCRVVESVLDVSHLPFVHPETTGSGVSPVVDGPDYRLTGRGIVMHPAPFAPCHPLQPAHPPKGLQNQTEIELIFPNQWVIRTPMGDDSWMCTFLTFTPVNHETTQIFGVVARNFDLDSSLLDAFHLDHTQFVMGQDKAIIECIRPTEAPDPRLEAHVASDAPAIRYRMMLFKALQQEQRD